MQGKFYIKLEGSEVDDQGVTNSGSIGFGKLNKSSCGKFDLLTTNKWLYLSGASFGSDYKVAWTMEGNIVELGAELLDILYGVENEIS